MPSHDARPTYAQTKLRWPLRAAVIGGLLAYLLLFFSQASVFGLTGEGGEPLSRWFDLLRVLLLEEAISSTIGGGRLEIGFLDRLPNLVATLTWMGVAWWIGRQCFRRIVWISRTNVFEQLGLYTLTGLALLSSTVLLVGCAGMLHSRLPLLIIVAALCVGLWCYNRSCGREVTATDWEVPPTGVPRCFNWRRAREATGDRLALGVESADGTRQADSQTELWLSRLVPVFTAGLAILYLLGALMPPWEFDVLAYHLASIKDFYQAGAIHFDPYNVYANMPLGAEMHGLAWMVLIGGDDAWWWGGLIGKAIIGFYSLLATCLVGGFVGRKLGSQWGVCAAALLLSVPGNMYVAMAGLIDFTVAAHTLAAFVIVLRSLDSPLRSFNWLALAAVHAGGAAACKYPGYVFAVVPLGVGGATMIWFRRRELLEARRGWIPLRISVAVLIGLSLTGLPWLVKNAVLTGNPFYPLLNSLFDMPGMDEKQIERWNAVHRVPGSEQVASYSLAAFTRHFSDVVLQSSFLAPLLWPFAVLSLIPVVRWLRGSNPKTGGQMESRQANWIGVAWLMVVWILVLWWLVTHRIDRFWLPAVPFLAILAGVGAEWLGRRVSMRLSLVCILLSLGYGGFLTISSVVSDNRFFVSLQALRYDAGDERNLGRITQATAWINRQLSDEQAKVLTIGEARRFDFEVDTLGASCFNTNPGEAWLRRGTADEKLTALHAAGVTHVLINWSEIARYRSPGKYGFSQWPTREAVSKLVDSGVLQPIEWSSEPTGVEIFRVPRAIQ